ncbi:MAG: DUF4268 domain-containing protein [Salinibacter sp.]
MVSKLNRIELRHVWKNEARDFTTWLEENIDVLAEAIELPLNNVEREQSAGAFNVDLLAEDDTGKPIVIENQLEKSDHDHLGKLITYMVSFDANVAIWIAADPRPEHVKAVSWLNESFSTSFYLLKLEAVQIDGSAPAPLLTLIVGPSEESQEVGDTKREWAERDQLRYRFWSQLLERSREYTQLHANISATNYNWLGTSSGIRGLGFNYSVRQRAAAAELYIDRGKGADEESRQVFDQLYSHKDEIEERFGESLDWEKLEGKRACRIKKAISGGYRDDEGDWAQIHESMIQAMIRLEGAMRPYLRKYVAPSLD